jgi:molybdate transport system ATP-binding protein
MASEVIIAPLAVRFRRTRHTGDAAPFTLGVTFDALAGVTILFGPSGAGKSTLLDCIAGLLRPDAGRIAVGETILFDSDARVNVPPQHRRVAYVFQSLALFPQMTVEENIAYGLKRLAKSERAARIDEILRSFRIVHVRERSPSQISGGEQQRVALARSLVTMPRVLLLDEPLSGLDAELKVSIMEDLRVWNAVQKIPILYVTHTRDEVDALGERVIVLDHGRIVAEGIPHEVLASPRRQKLAQAVGFENLLDATVLDYSEEDGTMSVRLGGAAARIEVPLGRAAVGDRVKLAIRAGDILLALRHPEGLSARNILEGKVVSIEQRGSLIVTRVRAGVTFTVHITPGAARALNLIADKSVWLVLKTHSCHLISD